MGGDLGGALGGCPCHGGGLYCGRTLGAGGEWEALLGGECRIWGVCLGVPAAESPVNGVGESPEGALGCCGRRPFPEGALWGFLS